MKKYPNLEITVYTNPNCSHCRRQIDWMKNQAISFKEKDISRNEEFLKELKELGGRGTPFTIINRDQEEHVVSGFNFHQLKSLLTPEYEI